MSQLLVRRLPITALGGPEARNKANPVGSPLVKVSGDYRRLPYFSIFDSGDRGIEAQGSDSFRTSTGGCRMSLLGMLKISVCISQLIVSFLKLPVFAAAAAAAAASVVLVVLPSSSQPKRICKLSVLKKSGASGALKYSEREPISALIPTPNGSYPASSCHYFARAGALSVPKSRFHSLPRLRTRCSSDRGAARLVPAPVVGHVVARGAVRAFADPLKSRQDASFKILIHARTFPASVASALSNFQPLQKATEATYEPLPTLA